MNPMTLAFWRYFASLPDPRVRKRSRHKLLDVIVIVICGVICNCKDWQKIEIWAKANRVWLQTFLELPNGIPSHDTLERVFGRLEPQRFQNCFQKWLAALQLALGVEHIAIDGKTLRGSGQPSSGQAPLQLISAWATTQRLTFGQHAIAEGTNEITTIPQLLKLLDLHGALVTIDAIGCQKKIAAEIVQGGGDYLLTVKENQPNLLADIQLRCGAYSDGLLPATAADCYESLDHGHGRTEFRRCTVLYDLDGIRNAEAWEKLCVVGMLYRERTVQGKTSQEIQFFIGSKKASAQYYAEAKREHWGIENGLHWRLDVVFDEDANRVRERVAAENLAWLRRVAITVLEQHPSKASVPNKSFRALLDHQFLQEILQSFVNPGGI